MNNCLIIVGMKKMDKFYDNIKILYITKGVSSRHKWQEGMQRT